MEEKVLCYDQLTTFLSDVPSNDRLFLPSDFNAKVGTKAEAWPNVISQGGLGEENKQGVTLLKLCTWFGLLISNTLFTHPGIHKRTWKHPRSQRWHMIDYIIIKQHYRSDLEDSRVRRSADYWTYHKMVCSRFNLRLHISPRVRCRKIAPRLNTARLKVLEIKQHFKDVITSKLPNISSEDLE